MFKKISWIIFISLPAFYLIMCIMHDSPKIFEKISIFENMTADFLLKYQSSLWWEISLIFSLENWFMEEKIVFCVWHGPQKWSKYHLHTIQTIFRKGYNIRGHYVFVNFFYAWKCIISGVIFRSKLWHLIRKSSVIFSRMKFFSKFFGESWGAYKMHVKNKNDSWTFY